MTRTTTKKTIATAALATLWIAPASTLAALPIDWPIDEIRDESTLEVELLNGNDGVLLTLCDGTSCASLCDERGCDCATEAQGYVACDNVPTGNEATSYRVHVIRFNGLPNSNHPDPNRSYDQVFGVAAIPAWAHPETPIPGELRLHGYGDIKAGNYVRGIGDMLREASEIGGWSLTIHGPGFGLVSSTACDTYKDVSRYSRSVDSGLVWRTLGLSDETCDLVSDFNQGLPCVDAWYTHDSEAPRPDLTYLATEYAYQAMRALTFMESGLLSVTTSKLLVIGGSFGGLTTFIVNGVDDRVDAAIPLIATGGFETHLQDHTGALRHLLLGAAGTTWENPLVQEAVSKFDPIYYAESQHAPVLMLVSGDDPLFLPRTYGEMFHLIDAPDKRMHISVKGEGHSYRVHWWDQFRAFVHATISGTAELPATSPEVSVQHRWSRCGWWGCRKTLVSGDSETLSTSSSASAYVSDKGTFWGVGNSLGYASRTLPPSGTAVFDWIYWRSAILETVHDVLIDGEAAPTPFRQSDAWTSGYQTQILNLGADVVKCAEVSACWTPAQEFDCRVFVEPIFGDVL